MKLKTIVLFLFFMLTTNSFSAGSSGSKKETLYDEAARLIEIAKKMAGKKIRYSTETAIIMGQQ